MEPSQDSNSIITKILLFGDNKLDFETNKNFTNVYNRVYFINKEIQLYLIRLKLNDSIVSFYSKLMRHLCFRLVTFFLHVKPDLLILVQAIVRVVQIYFKKLILLLLVNVRVYNVFPRLIYKTIVSCRLINKNVLEWFLLVTCKKHTLR